MGPVVHTGVSVAIGGAVWAATGEPLSIPVALSAGALNDVDHLLDHYNWYFRRNPSRFLSVFHAWEYIVIGSVVLAFAWHPLLLAGVLAHFSHLVIDSAFNKVHRAAYLLSFRAAKRFRTRDLLYAKWDTLSEYMTRMIPFWSFFEPALMRWPTYRKAADYTPELESRADGGSLRFWKRKISRGIPINSIKSETGDRFTSRFPRDPCLHRHTATKRGSRPGGGRGSDLIALYNIDMLSD